ncbi:MAG: hypothetical protein C4341_02130 [Armatimonadota bacterium]
MRLALLSLVSVLLLGGQGRLPQMPGYERWTEMRPKIQRSIDRGDVTATWVEDGKAFIYRKNGKYFRYDVETGKVSEAEAPPPPPAAPRDPRPRPARGRQYTVAFSADGEWRADYSDGNVTIRRANGEGEPIQVTTDGDPQKRVVYGTASWVYGEELNQNEAMWWSPDAKKLVFYRTDNRPVLDYYVTLRHTAIQNDVLVEPYPKAGAPNPIAARRSRWKSGAARSSATTR